MAAGTFKVEIEFTAGVWTDITSRVWNVSGSRGRDYELDQPSAGEMTFKVDNSDGALYPENASSPYYPNVKLFKKIRLSTTRSAVTKVLWTGYVETWPTEYMVDGGHFSTSTLQATDVLGYLNRVQLKAFYEQYLTALKPYRYWPLTNRTEDGTYPCTITGKLAREMTYGGSVAVSHDESPILGDEGQSVPKFEPSRAGMPNDDDPPENFSIIRLTHGPEAELPPNQVWSFLISFFVPPETQQIGDCVLLNIADADAPQANFIQVRAGRALSDFLWFHLNDFAGHTIDLNTNQNIKDGFPHTVYFEMSTSSENSWKWSFDGSTLVTQSGIDYLFDDIAVRGTIDIGASWPVSNSNHSQAYQGFVSNFAVFNRALTQAEITNAANIANGGGLLNTLEFRLDWIMKSINQSGLLAVAASPGKTFFQSAQNAGSTAAEAIQSSNDTELGHSYVNGSGQIVPVGRHSRASWPVSHHLGTSTYPVNEIVLEFDSGQMINDVTVSVRNGPEVRALNEASVSEYGTFADSQDVESLDIPDALARAQYLVSSYAHPRVRIKSITFNAATKDELWDLLMDVDINSCIQVSHSSLAGVDISGMVCWVEKIEWNIEPAGVFVTFQVSRAVTDAWLRLGDATLGKIGVTASNKLAY